MPRVTVCESPESVITIELDDLDLTAYDGSMIEGRPYEFKVKRATIRPCGIYFTSKGDCTYLDATFDREVAVLSLRKALEDKVKAAERKIQRIKKQIEELK